MKNELANGFLSDTGDVHMHPKISLFQTFSHVHFFLLLDLDL